MTRTLWLALFAASPAPALAGDWPQWRGPNRDGHAVGARLPVSWPADAPAPRWTARVGGGYAGPAVAGGRVYAMGAGGGTEAVVCLDAGTGREVWRHSYPTAFRPPDPSAGRGPNSTPLVDRGRVFAVGLAGVFHCLDAGTGRVVWKHDFRAEYWGDEKNADGDNPWFPACGYAASPLADGDAVVVPVGGPKGGAFAGFDRVTGRVAWKALAERSSYASPVAAAPAGVRQLVGFTGLRMVGLDAATREVLWDHPFKAMYQQTIVSPVVWKDLVVIAGEHRPTAAVRLARRGGKLVKEAAWTNDDLKAYTTTPVLIGDHLIGHDARVGRLVCLDMARGGTAWTSPQVGGFVSLTVAGDVVLALNRDGDLHVVRASAAEYAPVARWRVGEAKGTWAPPAVAGSRLYVKDKEHLVCYDLAN